MKSMQKKFFTFGLLIIFFVVAGLIIQYLCLNNKITKDRKIILTQANEQLSRGIEGIIKYYSQYTIAASEFILINDKTEDEIVGFLKGLKKNNPAIKTIYFGNLNNKVIATSDWVPPASYILKERPWYIKAIENKGIAISQLYVDALDNNLVVSISKPVYDNANTLLGVVSLDISIEKITEMVKNTTINGIGYSFLADGEGNILAHPKYKYQSDSDLINISSIGDGINSKIRNSDSGQIEIEFDGDNGYLTYSLIANTDWIIANFMSLRDIKDNNRDIWRMFFIALAITIIILALLTYLQKKNFLEPIYKLDKDIKMINVENNIAYRLQIEDKDPFIDIRNTINIVLNKTHEYFEQIEQDREEILAQHGELVESYGQLTAIDQELQLQYDRLVESEEELAYLSYHDQLTGLYNRRFFEEELHRLDVFRNLPISIIMADVNGLKLINDSFGHKDGDKLIKNVADILKDGCRQDDIVARLSGDEFVIILPKTDTKGAEDIIERCKNLSKNKSFLDDKLLNMELSISYGIGTKYTDDADIAEVLKIAEDNMYANKLFESPSMRRKTIETIIKALYEKDKREEQHSKRVAMICKDIGIQLGMNEVNLKEIETVGLLHDIGKIVINEVILENFDSFTKDELMEMDKHPEVGYRILNSVSEMTEIAKYVLYHHERFDGNGYPKGLKGEEIPLVSRIVAIADAYDFMVSCRSYEKVLSDEEIVKEFINNAGTQFDPKLVKIFIEKVLKFNLKEEKND